MISRELKGNIYKPNKNLAFNDRSLCPEVYWELRRCR
jgi:hypothetical protein